jgi:hypothetical protein
VSISLAGLYKAFPAFFVGSFSFSFVLDRAVVYLLLRHVSILTRNGDVFGKAQLITLLAVYSSSM